MSFNKELDFELALIKLLSTKGWESEVLENPSEKDLIDNWAKILYENNRQQDRLNDCPLTETEMQQIIEQIISLRTPLKLNAFINGKSVSIKRDNVNDKLHLGKEVSLKIYDRKEIAAGQSRYQIVRQPRFTAKSKILNDRKGDLMLLINGMPLFHIELKKSGIPISQAWTQIEKYSYENIFTGLFSLVLIFVAMTPEESVYFANPGPDGKFNPDYYFHWADYNNEPINTWSGFASSLLNIPMAHQLIGFYTVADSADGILKVMRSYQYIAASKISDEVTKAVWGDKNQRGGYVWHTTGSGKTLTSFKSAQLIANSEDADKVIFLMDRIELGTQSLKAYRAFAEASDEVQATENTSVLKAKLKSPNTTDTLIVTSIQKMSNIKDDSEYISAHDLETINQKRLVFIVDEAHRSTFGEMLANIKDTFPKAIFFGFTGTPIQEENQKNLSTTATIFGDELHRYSIADGIRDKNVLGFDPYKVLTFNDKDLRQIVALEKAKAKTAAEAINDEAKAEVFYHYMNTVKMAGYTDINDNYIKGIEDYLDKALYRHEEHQNKVVEDIIRNWLTLSHNGLFHAIFATSSIAEAIIYYKLMKEKCPELKVTCLFHPSIDNEEGFQFKSDGLVEIIQDYNARYERDYTFASHDAFKKDLAFRLAHKSPYERIEHDKNKQIDIVIVVNQLLTGFDSKWVNTLYLDKILKNEEIIQAFSRTNRLFGPKKPFGTIRYYRSPHSMERNIQEAVRIYSGNKPLGLFAERLNINLERLNFIFNEIKELFRAAKIENFEKLPIEKAERGKFASLFNELNTYLNAARVQGFSWNKKIYEFQLDQEEEINKESQFYSIELLFDKDIYDILLQRYKELFSSSTADPSGEDIPYEIKGELIAIKTDTIDNDYMNSRFVKYLKLLQEKVPKNILDETLAELHKSFAKLSQEQQKYANIFLHDIERGDVVIVEGKNLSDYIGDYQSKAKDEQIEILVQILGIDKEKLLNLMNLNLSPSNINEFGRFDDLKNTVDKFKAKTYFDKIKNKSLKPYEVNIETNNLLQKFILENGFEIVDK